MAPQNQLRAGGSMGRPWPHALPLMPRSSGNSQADDVFAVLTVIGISSSASETELASRLGDPEGWARSETQGAAPARPGLNAAFAPATRSGSPPWVRPW